MYVIISHRKDLDGLASAALSLRFVAKHKRQPYVISLKDYTDEDPVVEEKYLELQNSKFLIRAVLPFPPCDSILVSSLIFL